MNDEMSPSKAHKGLFAILDETNLRLVPKLTIKKILLLTPYGAGDSRWQGILFTPAALLLASGLEQAGFHTSRRQIPLPFPMTNGRFSGYDLVGITLFEDLVAHYPLLFEAIRREHSGLIVAGGPMATRLPERCMELFPEIDLLLRGEAEQAFAKALKWLGDPRYPPPEMNGVYLRCGTTVLTYRKDQVNRPQSLDAIEPDYNLLEDWEFAEGLELNISRGCPRSCIFCCHIQGRNQRRLDPRALDLQLQKARKRIDGLPALPPRALSCNINDDDLLLSPDYALDILQTIRRNGFKIWGLQTAVASFFDHRSKINTELLDRIADPAYYTGPPLLWLGTDAFLPERSRRLGKLMPGTERLLELLDAFEHRSMRHFHYWISSDHDSDWPEFITEISFILDLHKRFEHFGLLAHAPFLVPYPETALWRQLLRHPQTAGRIHFAQPIRRGSTVWNQALRVETADSELNKLLDNQPDQGGTRFFEALKAYDYFALFNRIYNGLRDARLRCSDPNRNLLLDRQCDIVADTISKLI